MNSMDLVQHEVDIRDQATLPLEQDELAMVAGGSPVVNAL
jgi:hypothetical protein